MMDLNKSREVFDPSEFTDAIHIIGCGAIGSTLAENIARLGIDTKITLYDFDKVEAHNIANQMFFDSQIGKPKTISTGEIMAEINPTITLSLKNKGYISQSLSGFVFLCVDNIDLRRKIVEQHMENPYIKAIFDFRMRLFDAQHYAADWSDAKSRENLLSTMQFSHDEASEATPTSACGYELSVHPTVRVICALGICNFMNFVKTGKLKKLILADPFNFMLDAF